MDEDLKYVITEEERTRHDALFYSQIPKKGFLSGEQARSLFIRSRLPLSELSKIWKLADITRDNMLDVSEFGTAMHLIQLRLRGFDIPEKLPPSLAPSSAYTQMITIPHVTKEEIDVYQKTFEWKDKSKTGFIDTETACGIMLSSKLESHLLARIWDLSDVDRDAKLTATEFTIALHLLRFCKKGNELDGSIDVMSLLPAEFFKDDGEAKKKRHTEVQTERRQLWTLKQKLCSEMTSGLDEEIVNEKIRPELNTVEEKLLALEKEETELRRGLLNLKDKSKKESFKPFDRSFLLKKRVSGSDLFKGDKHSYLGKDSVIFEKLWIAGEITFDDTGTAKEERNDSTPNYNGLDNDFSQTQPPEIVFTEVKRGRKSETDTPGLVSNGIDSVDKSIQSGYRLDSNLRLNSGEKDSSYSSTQESRTSGTSSDDRKNERQELSPERTAGKKVERNESFSWAAVQKRPIVQQTVNEEVLEMPESMQKGEVVDEFVSVEHKDSKAKGEVVDEFVSVEHKDSKAKTSDLDEQLKLLENDSTDHIDINENSHTLIEAEVTVEAESSPHQNLDNVFDQLSEENRGVVNGTVKMEKKGSTKLPVGRVLSIEEEKELVQSGALRRAERDVHPRSQPTQEDLLPLYLEEKRNADEERRKKREIEEEKIREAREERKRQEEETTQQLLGRKAAIQQAKGKLEKQISQSEYSIPSSDAGRLIEQELEEQRSREEESRRRMEQLRGEPVTHSKYADGGSKVLPKQINIESSSPQENKPLVTSTVVRRQKPEQRNPSNRKSWVELEIEQQKLKDEEMQREREERQKDTHRHGGQSHKQLHVIERDIEISEEPIISRTSQRSVESQPGANVMQTSQMFSRPPEKNTGATTREVNRPPSNNRAPVKVSQSSIHTKEPTRSSVGASNVRDVVDGKMTASELELEMKVREEEERHRLEQIENVRQESLKREAEELVRIKNLREEELRRKKEQHLKEAEKIKREEQERRVEATKAAEIRRFNFTAEKVRLEERVIRTMKEAQMESEARVRTASSSSKDEYVQSPIASPPPPPSDEVELRERRTSVRHAKAMFERPAASQEQPKVVMRQKRQSLNLDDTATVVKPHKKNNRASFYSDAIMTQEFHSKTTKEIDINHNDGPSDGPSDDPSRIRLVLGDIGQKRQQFETRQRSVENRQPVSSYADKTQSQLQSSRATDRKGEPAANTGSFYPSISNNKIQQEMQELRQKEEEIRSRRKGFERTSSSEQQDSLDGIKKNPLPSKMQVKTHAPSPPVSKQEPAVELRSAPKKNPAVRKSFIEMEKDREREREEALQREREAVMKEREMMFQTKETEQQAQIIIQQTKEESKKRPNAMASRWQNRGQFN